VAEWGKRLLFGSLLGAALGVLVGLGLARLLWPPTPPSPTPVRQEPTLPVRSVEPTLKPGPPTQAAPAAMLEEALLLISALYALDGDLARAQQRLAALSLDDPAEAVAELALRHAGAGNRQVATDLATLASALGSRRGELLAYVATAPPTHTPLPTLTPTFTFTPSPTPLPTSTSTSTPLPSPTRHAPTRPPSTAPPLPAATPLPLEWDHRVDLLSPPIRLVPANVAPGQQYWRLVRLEWWKAGEGGNCMIYVTTLKEDGQPKWGQAVIVENGGHHLLYTAPKPGEPYGANFPMSNTLNSYQVFVGGDLPSDRVTGLGLGEWLGGLDHTTFVLVFQRSIP